MALAFPTVGARPRPALARESLAPVCLLCARRLPARGRRGYPHAFRLSSPALSASGLRRPRAQRGDSSALPHPIGSFMHER